MNGGRKDDDQSALPSASPAKRTCLVVLGVHRSGTSALTRMLNLLGAALPAHVMEAGPSNEKGHWEPEPLVALHDELLAEAGTPWADITPLPVTLAADRLTHYQAEIVRLLNEEYGGAPLFVVKDPRMCRLMPLWRGALDRFGAIARFGITIRNPLEVARSLEKRDGLPVAHGCLLWLRDLLAAEYETRGARRVFLHYQMLLNDPIRTANRVGAELLDNWSGLNEFTEEEIQSFVDHMQRHHFHRLEDLRYPVVAHQWLREAYEACAALVFHPDDEKAQQRLDGVRTAFASASGSIVPLLFAYEMELKERDDKIAALDRTLAAHTEALNEHAKKLAALDEMRALNPRDVPAL